MRTYNLFLKSALLVVLLLNSINIARSCIDFDPEGNRFWLFSPNVSNMRQLMPFTYYSEETYYPGRFDHLYDTSHYAANITAWKAYFGGAVSETDINALLYLTPPKAYKAKKYDKNNGFVVAMGKDAELKKYIDLAKQYEEAYQVRDDWQSTSEHKISYQTNLIKALRQFLATAKQPVLKERGAYLLMKTLRNNGEQSEMTKVFQQYFQKGATKSWYYGSACYFQGETMNDSVQKAQYYVEAWRYNGETMKQVQRFFHHQRALPFIQQIQKPEDKAAMYALTGLSYPAPGMDFIQNTWKNDPNNAELPMLIAREVNKLEDWLLSPELAKSPNRLDFGIYYDGEIPPAPALKKKDMDHLHALRQWVDEVLTSGKRQGDKAFFQLTAAQLSFLDRDFAKAKNLADETAKLPNTPAQQQVQAQLLSFLSDAAANQTITAAMQEHIPSLWTLIENNQASIENPSGLKSQLALLLSDLLRKKGEVAKSCLLLSRTGENQDFKFNTPEGHPYDMLLEYGKSADYDQALQILGQPNGTFEKWLAAKGASYRYNWEARFTYNEKTFEYKPNPNYKPQWNTLKIRELKAMYYTRQDQLDSALLELKKISPIDYDYKDNEELKYYFAHNPFSTGIDLPYLALANTKLPQPFNKITFLEKLLELKQSAQGKQKEEKQRDFLLIANAYYNMSYAGRGWWLMNTPFKGSGDIVDAYIIKAKDTRTGHVPNTSKNAIPTGLGIIFSLGLIGIFISHKRNMALLVVTLAVGTAGFYACKRQDSAKNKAQSAIADDAFVKNYATSALAKAWYKKAAEAAPETEMAVVAQMMMHRCDIQEEQLQWWMSHDRYEDFKPTAAPAIIPKNINYSPSAMSCQYFSDFVNGGK